MVSIPLSFASTIPPIFFAQSGVEFLVGTNLGKLLLALVVVALVVFIGRFVLGVAWKLLRIAIVVVGALWLLSVVAPTV